MTKIERMIASEVYKEWMLDPRWGKRPMPYFWAELAAQAIAQSITRLPHTRATPIDLAVVPIKATPAMKKAAGYLEPSDRNRRCVGVHAAGRVWEKMLREATASQIADTDHSYPLA
jgi:hypothetical protein